MRTIVGQDQSQWLNLVWTWIHTEIKEQQRVFIPAGNTPLPLYRRCVAEPTSLLKSLKLLQLDDILTGPRKGEFKTFFVTELPTFLPQFEWIGEGSSYADVAILGVGLNGHVAFHEPGLAKSLYSGCVPLSQSTLSALKLTEPTWGITYGVEAFLRASKILVLARGESKKQVLQKALREKNLPVSWILEHSNVTLISDFSL